MDRKVTADLYDGIGERAEVSVPKVANSVISQEMSDKIHIHGELCDKLKHLYATKNADYGDSMHPLFKEYGMTAFLVMFSTKIQRIKSLQYKQNNYESMEDSLMDLANYALIALTELTTSKDGEVH